MTQSAIAEWEKALADKMVAGKSKADATRELVRENPGLHARYLAEFNAAHPNPTRRA